MPAAVCCLQTIQKDEMRFNSNIISSTYMISTWYQKECNVIVYELVHGLYQTIWL